MFVQKSLKQIIVRGVLKTNIKLCIKNIQQMQGTYNFEFMKFPDFSRISRCKITKYPGLFNGLKCSIKPYIYCVWVCVCVSNQLRDNILFQKFLFVKRLQSIYTIFYYILLLLSHVITYII